MSTTVDTATEIRPFHTEIPEEQIDDLRRRIEATRWPTKELVEDRSQGVQLAALQQLACYWTTEYDWRKAEARLNELPQFITEIDGVEIHFIRGADEDFVFAHPERGSKLDADWYRERFLEALSTAGVEGHIRTFHDMRHTAITNLAATGASPIAVMATAGHRSMSTTKGYMHLAGVVFRDEASALERRLLGDRPATLEDSPRVQEGVQHRARS